MTKTPVVHQILSSGLRSPRDAAQRDEPCLTLSTDCLVVPAKDAARLLGISRAQLWKLHSQGKVPAPIRLGTKAPRWRVDELRSWLAAGAPDRQTWIKMQEGRR